MGEALAQRVLPRPVRSGLGAVEVNAGAEVRVRPQTGAPIYLVEIPIEPEFDTARADEPAFEHEGPGQIALHPQIEIHAVGVLRMRVEDVLALDLARLR